MCILKFLSLTLWVLSRELFDYFWFILKARSETFNIKIKLSAIFEEIDFLSAFECIFVLIPKRKIFQRIKDWGCQFNRLRLQAIFMVLRFYWIFETIIQKYLNITVFFLNFKNYEFFQKFNGHISKSLYHPHKLTFSLNKIRIAFLLILPEPFTLILSWLRPWCQQR